MRTLCCPENRRLLSKVGKGCEEEEDSGGGSAGGGGAGGGGAVVEVWAVVLMVAPMVAMPVVPVVATVSALGAPIAVAGGVRAPFSVSVTKSN